MKNLKNYADLFVDLWIGAIKQRSKYVAMNLDPKFRVFKPMCNQCLFCEMYFDETKAECMKECPLFKEQGTNCFDKKSYYKQQNYEKILEIVKEWRDNLKRKKNVSDKT